MYKNISSTAKQLLPSFTAALTGFSALLPIGMVYLSWFALAIQNASQVKILETRCHRQLITILLIIIFSPPLLATFSVFIHGIHDQTATRLFHSYRNAFIILIGLALTQIHRQWIWRGALTASLVAVAIIATHHFIYPLPLQHPFLDLLQVNGNAGSQKMIMMATVAGCLFWLFLEEKKPFHRRLYFAGWLIISGTVALHSISRNAYLALLMLPAAAIIYRYRKPRAWILALITLFACSSIIWLVSSSVRERTLQAYQELRIYAETGTYTGSADVRARMMTEAFQQMINHPLTGTGTGTWLEHWKKPQATRLSGRVSTIPITTICSLEWKTAPPGSSP